MIAVNYCSPVYSIIAHRQLSNVNSSIRTNSAVCNNIAVPVNDFISNVSSISAVVRNNNRIAVSYIYITAVDQGRSRVNSDIFTWILIV